jgi:hypothetical protein
LKDKYRNLESKKGRLDRYKIKLLQKKTKRDFGKKGKNSNKGDGNSSTVSN